jgi:hypothetical protein
MQSFNGLELELGQKVIIAGGSPQWLKKGVVTSIGKKKVTVLCKHPEHSGIQNHYPRYPEQIINNITWHGAIYE